MERVLADFRSDRHDKRQVQRGVAATKRRGPQMTGHTIGTREEWQAARATPSPRKGAHETRRRARAAATRAAVGARRRSTASTRTTVKDARRAVRRALPAARLPLHVRPQLPGRLPGEFVNCRLDRRRAPAPARAGRDDAPRLTSAAGEAAGLQAPHGLEHPLGLGRAHRVQLRPRLLVHRGAGPRGRGADEGAPGLEPWARSQQRGRDYRRSSSRTPVRRAPTPLVTSPRAPGSAALPRTTGPSTTPTPTTWRIGVCHGLPDPRPRTEGPQ